MIFAFSTMSIMVLLAIFIPKRISGIEVYSTFFFAYWLGMTVEIILDLKYNLYGYESKGVQYPTYIYLTVIYFSVNTLFLNYYPYKKSLITSILYIFSWSIFSIAYELILLHTNFYYYNGWKWWYSALIYPIVFTVLRLNLAWVQKMLSTYLKQNTKVTSSQKGWMED